jgi:hypothetical protein
MFNKILNSLNNPITAILIIIFFCIIFFIYNGIVNKTHNNFLSFGPTKDENGKSIYFLGSELNTWHEVIITYIFIFIITIFSYYYENVMEHNIYHYLNNYVLINIKNSKLLFYIATLIDPFIKLLIHIIDFYTVATFQFQYLIPKFIASYLITIPFLIHLIESKKFI